MFRVKQNKLQNKILKIKEFLALNLGGLQYDLTHQLEVLSFSKFCFLLLKYSFFHKQQGSGLSPQSWLYFQGFWSSKLLNGCLVV